MMIKVFSNGNENYKETQQLKSWLENNKIPFISIDLKQNPEFFDYVVNRLKFQNMPVIDIGGIVSFNGYSEILLNSNKKLMQKVIKE